MRNEVSLCVIGARWLDTLFCGVGAFLICVASSFDAMGAWRDWVTVDGVTLYFVAEDDGTATIGTGMKSYVSMIPVYDTAIPDSTQGSFSVPETLMRRPVVGVNQYAFYECDGLTSVSLPLGVKFIGENAFQGCRGLTEFVVPESVERIDAKAFEGCTALSKILLPSGLLNLGKQAFDGCVSLDLVQLPSSVTNVGQFAFAGCKSIKSMTIPSSVHTIGVDAFSSCVSLKEVEILDGVKKIGAGAFAGCSNLVSVVVPYSVTSIEEGAFRNCATLSSIVLPEGLSLISYDMFERCSSLSNVVIPSSVKAIGAGAFEYCSRLKSIEIPEGVEAIHSYAFAGCPLSTLTIPSTVTNIGAFAFSGLKSITILASEITLESCAFAMTDLKEVVFPPSVKGVNPQAFPSSCKIIYQKEVTVRIDGISIQKTYDGARGKYAFKATASDSGYDVGSLVFDNVYSDVGVGDHVADWADFHFGNTDKRFQVKFVFGSVPHVNISSAIVAQDGREPGAGKVTEGGVSKFDTIVTYDGKGHTLDVGRLSDVKLNADTPRFSYSLVSNGVYRCEPYYFTNSCITSFWYKISAQNYSEYMHEVRLTILPREIVLMSGSATKKYNGMPLTCAQVDVFGEGYVNADQASVEFIGSQTLSGESENAFTYSFPNETMASNYCIVQKFGKLKVLPREVTLTSGSASKNFDGTALRCERVEVTGDGFVTGEGVDVVYTGSQLWPGSSENTFTYSFKDGTLESNYDVTTANGTLTVGAVGRVLVGACVTAIPAEAFKNYAELTEVVLPDTVTEIGADAFAGCTKLSKVAFPAGMEVTREKLRGWGLSDAVLDDYVEGDFIIVNTSLLGYVGAAEVAELVIPDGIELIDEYALSELYDLERVELPETVRFIGKGAFANDTYLDEVVLPDSVEVIGAGAFENCSWMQTMTMGAGVRSVGDRAFAGCTKLAAAKFADGLGEVGDAAFSNCWRMMSVSLPVSVSNVAATAFKDCASLTGVTVPTMIAPMSEWFAPIYRQIENVTVPKGATEVCAEMFAGCAALKTVELPEGVTNIASGAFRDCVALETILLPESLEAIGDEVFAGCAALKAIVLPKNVAVLGKRVFSGCATLSDVTLSRALTAIPDGTFAGCDALDSFVVPEAVTELGSRIVPSATTAIYYLGNAPSYAADVYAQANAALVSYVVDGTKGWDGRPMSRDIPQTWPTSNARTIRTWSPVKVDVTFVGNGGAFANPAGESCVCEQIVDTAYSLPPYEPVRKGYRFDGYWTEANGGTRVTSGVSVKLTKAHSLYAHWAVGQSVTVRFNATGGTVEPEERVYVSEAPFGELPVPVRTHYDFAGWFTEVSGGTQVTAASEVPLADRELFAHWTAKQYVIRFHANDGTERTTDQPFTYGTTVTLAKNGFVRTGYAFAGWAAAEDGGSTVYADGAEWKDVTAIQDGIIHLYALWVANSYEVRFDANGGEGTMEPQGFVYDEAKALRANTFVRDGYEFVEWNVSAPRREDASGTVGDGVIVSNMTTVAGGVVTLYAQWDEIAEPPPVEPPEEPIDPPEDPEQPVIEPVVTNTITYLNLQGAANTNVTEFTTNDLPLVLGPVEREGWRFLGWTPNGGVIPVGTAANVTFMALWEKIVEPPPVKPPEEPQSGEPMVVCAVKAEYRAKADVGVIPVEVVNVGEAVKIAVKGLPGGVKFTAKDVKATAKSAAVSANSIYGAPTKSGVYAATVTVTPTDKKSKMAPIVKTLMFVVRNAGEHIVRADCDAAQGTVKGMGVYAPGKKVTLKATAAKGYVFSGWYDGDALISRLASYVLTMPDVDVNLMARFVTVVADKGSIALAVTAGGRNIVQTKSITVKQGIYVEWPVVASALSATTVKVSGLPSGLKFTAKDVKATKTSAAVPANTIYGTPKTASKTDKNGNVTPSKVKITVTTAGKAKQEYVLTVTVRGIPAEGTFNGGSASGLVTLTVAKTGKISGKYLADGKTWTLSAAGFDTWDDDDRLTATLTAKSGKEVKTVALVYEDGYFSSPLFEAWRNEWKTEPQKSLAATLKGLKVTVGENDNIVLTVGANGAVTAKGTFSGSDGKSYSASCSTVLIPTESKGRYVVYLYFPPKAGKFGGWVGTAHVTTE